MITRSSQASLSSFLSVLPVLARVRELFRQASRLAIPFTFGPRQLREPASIRNATCSAIETPQGAFLLTADHVLVETLSAIESGENIICRAGCLELRLLDGDFYRKPRHDIATIPIPTAGIQALEAFGWQIVRPQTWPAAQVELGDVVIVCGFPGTTREIVSWEKGVFPSLAIAGIVNVADDDWCSYRGNPQEISQVDVRRGEQTTLFTDLRGISGGPVFRIVGPALYLELVGAVSEG